jgi:CheY-like chemotaxis protein
MTKWILLADDNEQDADLSLRALTRPQTPADVILAHDGAEALDCLYRRGGFQRLEGSPALVLLDLKMPKVDGLEVLRRIKADNRLKKIPVVIFTSSREESDSSSYELGANAWSSRWTSRSYGC